MYPENIIELFSTSIDQVPAQINKLPQSSPFSSPPAPRKQQPPEDHRAHKRHHWNAFSPSPPASARKTDPLSSAPGCLLPPGPGHTVVLISRTQSSCPTVSPAEHCWPPVLNTLACSSPPGGFEFESYPRNSQAFPGRPRPGTPWQSLQLNYLEPMIWRCICFSGSS